MSSRILTAIDCKFSFLQLILKACITHLPDSLRRTIYDFGASLFLTLGGSQSKTHPLIHHPYVRRLPFGLVLKICSKSEGLREATALRTLEGLSRNAVNHPVFFDCVLGSLSSRDADDADNDDRTCYLIQTWIDGPRLCDVYHDYFTSDDTNRLVEDMQLQFTDLQSLTRNTNNPIICGAGGGPITDYRLPWLMEPGAIATFTRHSDFAKQMWFGLHHDNVPHRVALRPDLLPLVERKDVPVCFAHGDLLLTNIILEGGIDLWRAGESRICLIDWEQAGWMPEYWDAVKSTWMDDKGSEWDLIIRRVFPQFSEWLDVDWEYRSRSHMQIM